MTSRISIAFAAALLFTLSACGQTGTGATADSNATVAITHVTVIDGTGTLPRTDQTVLLDGDKIGTIGSTADVKIPKKVRVIDGTGKYLLPGFWDLHVHLHYATPEVLPVFVANGITGIRELDTPMPEIDSIRARARSGELLTPRIMAAGKMIEAAEIKPFLVQGPKIISDFALGDRVFVKDTAEARAAVRELAALKPDLLKHHNAMKRDVFFAVLEEARKAGLRVAGHFPMGEKITLREVAVSGQASIEHLGWPGVSADFKKLSPEGQDSLVAIVRSTGLAFVPTFVVGNFAEDSPPGADSIRLVQSHQDPRARFITPAMWEVWDGMVKIMAQYRKSGATKVFDFPGEIAMLRRFNQAGIPILPGTDFMVEFVFPGSGAQEEVANLVSQVEMTPNEAIQAASRRSAELLGLGAETGTIATGKSADVFLVDANPLVDIKNTQRIVGVARQGKYFDRAQLDSLLNEAANRLQKAPKP